MLGGCLTRVPSRQGDSSQHGQVMATALGLQEGKDLERQKEWDHSVYAIVPVQTDPCYGIFSSIWAYRPA